MQKLKGAVFSLRDVLVREKQDEKAFLGVIKLIRFVISKGVQPVLVSNSQWVLSDSKKPFEKFLSEKVGAELPFFKGGRDIAIKQRPEAMAAVLDHYGWSPQEAVYIGSTKEDMISAAHGGLLFLNAQWYATNSPYGFQFSSAEEIARFIECCCLIPNDWFWGFEDDGYRCFSIAPLAEYSRRYPGAAAYSADAKNAAKFNKGDLRFWSQLMAARLHFSGISAEANYVAPYPGHRVGAPQMLLTNALKMLPGKLRSGYLADLIVRHTTAQKSQNLRRSGLAATPSNQLSTISLRRDPLRTGDQARRFKSPPLNPSKTVLIVDDICTQGNSFEAARSFVESTGAKVIAVSWLKTPANDYSRVTQLTPRIKSAYAPYSPVTVNIANRWMNTDIINPNAPIEVQSAFQRFSNWDWPDGI
jgi:hypothetical protein